jgi:hypothetical protein
MTASITRANSSGFLLDTGAWLYTTVSRGKDSVVLQRSMVWVSIGRPTTVALASIWAAMSALKAAKMWKEKIRSGGPLCSAARMAA